MKEKPEINSGKMCDHFCVGFLHFVAYSVYISVKFTNILLIVQYKENILLVSSFTIALI